MERILAHIRSLLVIVSLCFYSITQAQFVVTSTADDGAGTLRQAIVAANGSSGETITFDLAGTGPWTIDLLSELPSISQPTTIDGTSQTDWDFATENMVTLDLAAVSSATAIQVSSASVNITGLKIVNANTAVLINGEVYDNISITDNIFNENAQTAITIVNGDNITIQGNHIGVSGDGLTDVYANGAISAQASDNLTIGGDRSSGEGNMISGSEFSSYLVSVTNSNTFDFHGNVVGASLDGNDITYSRGLYVVNVDNISIGSSSDHDRNFFNGIDSEVVLYISSSDIVGITNNYFGIGVDDSHLIGNTGGNQVEAIHLYTSVTNFTIDGNVISGGNEDGIRIGGNNGTSSSIINNIIGLAPDTLTAFGNAQYGINFAAASMTFSDITVGGSGNENIIAYNDVGIRTSLTSFGPIDIQENSIYCNSTLGINISGTPVVTEPIITTINPGSVSGTSVLSDGALIYVYEINPNCSDNQGYKYVGSTSVTSNAWSLTAGFDATALVALADDGSNGVSEFSASLDVPNIVVNSTADDGSGGTTLREAIALANSNPGSDSIVFHSSIIDQTITLQSPVTIASGNGDATFIDGDIDDDGVPDITITGGSFSGIEVNADNCVIKGLNFQGFAGAANAAIDIDGTDGGGTGNSIIGNYVGTALDGQSAGTANFRGVAMVAGASGNFIGDGTSGGRNIFSNNSFGVYISASDNNTVSGNIIGLNLAGNTDLGNAGSGVEIINSNNSVIGVNGALYNVISGNGQEGISLTNSTGTTIVNNYIGNPGSGSSDLGNDGEGILLDANSSSTTIGDGTSGGRNIIVFNGEGIEVGSDNNTIIGNYIGIAQDGNIGRGNGGMGIYITSGATGNYVGDGTTGGRNVIGANSSNGILIGDGPNYVLGNYIGINAVGIADRGNGAMGIVVSGGTGNIIGGTTVGERNVISGNLAGISVTVADVMILGNYIGLRSNGGGSIPNDNEGIRLGVNAQNVQIGDGTQEGANFISGNTLDGVLLGGASVSSNTLNYNYIGLRGDMETAEPNGGNGIIVESGANGNTITNTIISANTENGIQLDGASTQNNTISQNSIYGNTLKGIHISNGAQGVISTPAISDFAADGMLSGTSSGNETIEIFFVSADEGDIYVASTTASGGSWSYDIPESDFPNGLDMVTVTATDASGNTSEFSSAVGSIYDLFEVVNTNDEGGGSLRWCIENAEVSNDVNTITFDIPVTDPNYDNSGGRETWTIPVLSDFVSIGYPIVLDASTQTGTGNFRIVLDGQNTAANGLRLNGTGSEVYGFYIRRFTSNGIYMGNPGETFIIGGIGKGNTIVENGANGIFNLSANDCEFYGNYIGTNEDGDTGIGNGGSGIGFGTYASGGIIGGDDPGERNIISGNSGSGISFNVSGNTQIINNYIGTDPTGTMDIANSTGIYIGNSGGSTVRDNVISGNNSHGIFLFAGGNNHDIFNNKIGVASDGYSPLGNDIGVAGGSGADNNTIGGLGVNEPNIIAHNSTYGVNFPGAGEDFNSIIGNAIYCNGKGINLGTTGNESKAAPVITSIVAGTISGTGVDTDVIHVYRDTSSCSSTQGSEYLGMTTVSGGVWTFDDGSITVTDKLNATATDVNGNTSEFANDFGEIAVFDGPDNTYPELTDGQTELVYVGSGLQGANLDYLMTIDNLALVPLDVTSVDVAGIYYSIVSPPSIVDLQSSENFTIRLSQTTPGVFTSTVSINSNDDDENPFGFGIIGEMKSSSFTKPGNALHFDGSDDYVSMNAGSLDIVGDLTLEAWIKLDSYPSNASVIISRADEGELLANNIQYQFRVQPDGKIGIVYEYGNGANEASYSTDSVGLDEWTHVAVTRLINGSEADITFYIDGIESGTETLLNIPAGGTTGTPWIGSNNQVSFRYRFSGAIDELRVWDDVRDVGEIQAHLYSELTGDEDNLQAYYKFDHGVPNGDNTAGYFNLVNLAGGHHGILQNFTLDGSSSNYVGSEALFPNSAKARSASNITEEGFIANFEVPAGVVDVLIDIDDDADFSSPLATGISAGTTGSVDIVMALTPGNDYYFRTEADYGSLVSAKSASRAFRVQPGNALDFDGTNDYVDLGNPDELRIPGDITLEAWIHLDGTSSNPQTIICHSGTGESTATNFLYQFAVDASNKLQLFFEYGSGSDQFMKATEEVPLDEWVHVAVVRDATARTVDFYMNGILLTPDGTNTYPINATGGTGTGNRVWIGEAMGSPGTRFFNGKIDELRVWDATRTQEEIDDNKYKSLTGTEENLVANYRFDSGDAGNDNSGITTLVDEVSGLDGTLTNFALNGSNSNWINSQGSTPKAAAAFQATKVSVSGFTANFEVPVTATEIYIDVDDDADFSSPLVTGVAAGLSGSFDVTVGLDVDKDYYYRTQAEDNGYFSEYNISNVFRVQPGNALDFDGIDDVVVIADDADFQFGTGDFTLEAWFYFDGSIQKTGIVSKRNPVDEFEQYDIIISDGVFNGGSGKRLTGVALPDNRTYVGMNKGPNDRFVFSTEDLTVGWHHAALVNDYDVGLMLYLDGILQDTDNNSHGGLSFNIVGQPLTIGNYNSGTSHFIGKIDEVRIWNTARTETELNNLLYESLSGNENGLMSYYNFDTGSAQGENSGQTLLKDLVSGHDGTLTNFDLSGNSSNWTLSEALAPQSAHPFNATNVSISGFQANFHVPDGVTNVTIDVDDNKDFSSPLASSLSAGTSGTFNIEITLDPGTTYYFRTRAEYNSEFSYYRVSNGFEIKPGNGLNFDGIDDYVEIPDDDSLKVPTEITLALWAKRNELDRLDILLEKGGDWTGGTTNYGLGLHNNSLDNMFYFYFDGGWRGTQGVTDLDWHHYAVVAREGETNVSLYIDGIEQIANLTNGAATITLDESSTDPLYLGAQKTGITYYGATTMDEVQIWNRGLTHMEIRAFMYRTLKGNEPGLMAYYQFDEGDADGSNIGVTFLSDYGQNSLDGELNNFALTGSNSNWTNSEAQLNDADFISTWKSYALGTSNSNQIMIPTEGSGYDYDIYWEDITDADVYGLITGVTGDHTITFPTDGEYRIEIKGNFPRIYFNNENDHDKIMAVNQWGDQVWTSFNSAFDGCSALTIPASDAPDLSSVTDMTFTFSNTEVFNDDISHWDVSNVELMGAMFSGASTFNQPLDNWNVGNVSNMVQMFAGASSFDQPLDSWDVSNVENMSWMFNGAVEFNQDLNSWNTLKVKDVSHMFQGASSFDGNITDWNVSEVTDFSYMFTEASSFNQYIGDWDITKALTITAMFWRASSFNQPLNNWVTTGLTDLSQVFQEATAFNQPLNAWDVSNVTGFSNTFHAASSFNQDLNDWDVSKATSMRRMFLNASSFNQSLDTWEVGLVQTMDEMFLAAADFDQTLGNWNVVNVLNMNNMLAGTALTIANYDATLIGWAQVSGLQDDVPLGSNLLEYCGGLEARQTLIDDHNWAITGDTKNCSASGGVTPNDYDALVELYNATDGPNWASNTNWLSGDVSAWYGVVVNNNRVEQILLESNNLNGSLPSNIGNLSALSQLNLHENQLSGSIPADVGQLTLLTELELGQNQLSGSIPNELSNLVNLEILDLGNLQLSGDIPATLANLTTLVELYLQDNQFESLPDLSGLTSLTEFHVEENNLEFDDLEPNAGITGIQYSPQNNVAGPDDLALRSGDPMEVGIEIGGSENSYQWVKEGAIIDDQTTNVLLIDQVVQSDAGSYHLRVTNTLVPGLTIETDAFEVSVEGTIVVTVEASETVICSGESVILTASGAETYTWDNSVTDGIPFTPSETNTYTVVGEDDFGNTDTTQVTITVNPLPNVIATSSSEEICLGESISLSGTGAITYEWDQDVVNSEVFTPTATNRYRVTGIDQNGCVNMDSIDVFVRTASKPNVTLTEEVGRHLTLLSSESTGTYQWLENGNELEGETNQTLAITISAPEDDQYQVKVTEGNCSNISDPFFAPVLGIQEKGIHIYPSPASDYIVVLKKGGFDGQSIQLFNTRGQLVKSIKTEKGDRVRINVSELKSGIYFIDLGNSLEKIKIQKD